MNTCKIINTCQATFRDFVAICNPIKVLFTIHIIAPLFSLKTKNFKSSLIFFLICIFLITSEIGHFFTGLLDIFSFFSLSCLYMSFPCISIGVFVFFLFTCMNLFHIKDVNILSLLFIDYIWGGKSLQLHYLQSYYYLEQITCFIQ